MKMKIVLAIVASLLMLVVCSVNGQCIGQDTLAASYMATANSQVESPCVAMCSGSSVARFNCPPGSFYVVIAGGLPDANIEVVFKNGCDTILLDTCITRNVDGVFNPVGYCSINYALMEVWGSVPANYIAMLDSASSPITLLLPQGLCSTMGMAPRLQDSILIQSTNFQGQPWESGPRIDTYKVGDGYIHRKFWDVIR